MHAHVLFSPFKNLPASSVIEVLSVLQGAVQTRVLHSCAFSLSSPSSSVLPSLHRAPVVLWTSFMVPSDAALSCIGDSSSTPRPSPQPPMALAKEVVPPSPAPRKELKKSLNPKIHSPLPGSPSALPSRDRSPPLYETEAFLGNLS